MTEPNNTLATATFIGALGFTPTSIFDFVGATDTQDYWRFTLSGTSDINIGLTGLTADADVQLLNSAGTVIGSSTRGGTNSEDIHFNASPAGTYYVRVFQFSGDTNYNLRLSTADPSNILAPQENLGNIGNTAVIRAGSINSNNSSDFYRFSVASLANVNAQLTGLSADADLRIIQDVNNSGTVDAGDVTLASTSGGTTSENLNITALAGGNYFAQVYQFGSSTTNYSLRLITEDNSLASANNIGTLTTTPVSFSNFVGATDTQDYWRFTLSGTSDINIGLTGLTADADVQLLNSAGTVIGSSTRGGTNSEDIHFNASPAGTYYVRVFQFSGDTNYNLRLSTADPSNILAPQENLGPLVGSVNRSDFVGSNDTSDFYRFSVFGSRQLTAVVNGLSADADLRLIRDINLDGIVQAGEIVASSAFGGSSPEFINRVLGTGDYYLQVYQFSGDTNYNLGVTLI